MDSDGVTRDCPLALRVRAARNKTLFWAGRAVRCHGEEWRGVRSRLRWCWRRLLSPALLRHAGRDVRERRVPTNLLHNILDSGLQQAHTVLAAHCVY